MLAMNPKSNVSSADNPKQEEQNEQTEESGSGGRMTVPSGLSALIQAASCQLSLLAEESASSLRERSSRIVTMTLSEDTTSSDGVERLDAPERTPTMVPEPDPRRQSFPELLMTLALDPSNIDVIAFLPDDKFFAIRCKDFSENLMVHYFAVASFVEFLDLSQDWGFTRVTKDNTCSGIEVFRHPCFIKGDWERCAHIKFGESPTDARLSALPERARIEYTMSDDSTSSKRRLSPSFISRRESESSVTSQKQKVDTSDLSHGSTLARKDSSAESETAESPASGTYTHVSRTDDLRSIALSITTEKLNIKGDKQQEKNEVPLIERAVESATHTIVTDAIESLLRDEGHTKETYLEHERELSHSSLPGVVPISTQLFSPQEDCGLKSAPSQQTTNPDITVKESSIETAPPATDSEKPSRAIL